MKVKIDGVETDLHVHACPVKGMRDHYELATPKNECAYSFRCLPNLGTKLKTNGHVFEFANEKGEYRK